jgi:hypothetical protein
VELQLPQLRRPAQGTHPRPGPHQSSIAASGDDENWVLFNASPDVLQQIRSFPALQPARALRDTGIAAIVLIDAQIDHTTGLYMLREHRKPWPVWCTACVREDLSVGNPVFGVLGHYSGIDWRELPLQARFAIDGAPGSASRRWR